MSDSGNRTPDQLSDLTHVGSYEADCKRNLESIHITSDTIKTFIDNLPGGTSPGIDGITSEHLKNGKTPRLYELLSNLYSITLSSSCVPTVFQTGFIA